MVALAVVEASAAAVADWADWPDLESSERHWPTTTITAPTTTAITTTTVGVEVAVSLANLELVAAETST